MQYSSINTCCFFFFIIKNKQLLNKLGVNKAHIIAWSISGLDYRFYISKLGGDKYISSLTTIATPHRYY